MTSFFRNRVIPFLWKWEGTTYENDPSDSGGATKFGIDQRSHPSVNIKDLTENEAISIYWSEWVGDGCEHLSFPVDWVFFDACVNCGIGRANKFLKACGGDAGKFLDERTSFYKSLADHNPRLKKFLNGWLARTEDLRKEISRQS